ncbi:12325_t:CDS:2 [Ambispora leptoticha]|uniref:12325_t:CDS:1 n=1 Tax=Ambispora leptoticha TaxID=144679 RepID=A0A9N9F163_9GLOM|nr:12325_t:CDS:2 [Ambispora leptoticha]
MACQNTIFSVDGYNYGCIYDHADVIQYAFKKDGCCTKNTSVHRTVITIVALSIFLQVLDLPWDLDNDGSTPALSEQVYCEFAIAESSYCLNHDAKQDTETSTEKKMGTVLPFIHVHVFTLLCTILIFNNAAQPKKSFIHCRHVCRCYNKRSWPSRYDWRIPSLSAYDDYYYNHYPVNNNYYDAPFDDESDEILPIPNTLFLDEEREQDDNKITSSPSPATSNTTITIQATITVPLNATNNDSTPNITSTIPQTQQNKKLTKRKFTKKSREINQKEEITKPSKHNALIPGNSANPIKENKAPTTNNTNNDTCIVIDLTATSAGIRTAAEIHKRTGIGLSTIYYNLKKLENKRSVTRSGRLRKIDSTASRSIGQLIRRNPEETTSSLAEKLSKKGTTVSRHIAFGREFFASENYLYIANMGLLYNILNNFQVSDIWIVSLTIVVLYVIHFYYKYFTRINPFPGPIPIPLIGSFAIFMEDIDDWFHKLNKKYGHNGVYELNIAGNRQIVITRAEYVDKLVATDNKAHLMRTANNGLLGLFDLEKKGVGLNHDYNYWKFNRHIFSQAIMPLSLTEKPSTILNQLYDEMARHWIDLKQPNNKGSVIDISAWMRHFTADFISMLTAGKRMAVMQHYCQKLKNEPPTKEMIETEEFIECINAFVSDNQIIFVPKLLRGLPFIRPRVDKLLNSCHRFYDLLVNIVKEKRKEIEEKGVQVDADTRMDLLTSLLVANTKYDPNPQDNVDPSFTRPMNDDEIRGVMFDAFVAGTDTTVNTFCFALYYITHHPEVKKKLLKEIETVFKNDPNKPITLEDLPKLKYTEAIIKETSRIRPTVSMVSRYSNRPDEIAGCQWPANTLFIMYVRGINNNPLYWKDPERFIPERFYDSQGIHKNSFSMFGGGPRMCLGRKIAIIELITLLASVYRQFDIELMDMNAPLKLETSTITVCKELKIRVIPREKIGSRN